MELVLDPKKTRVVVHTYAEGMLARLAKDLALECGVASGTLVMDEDSARAEIIFDADRFRVVGVLKGDAVDERALSEGDRTDISKKWLRAIGVTTKKREVTISATLDGERNAKIDVRLPCGQVTVNSRVDVTKDATMAEARGDLELSLSALGVEEVRGPLHAFRLADRVRVIFHAVFSPKIGS
jgi:hypothetical protein